MFCFCAYIDYTVSIKNDYCYIDEVGEHRKATSNFEKKMCGGELASFISELVSDNYFCELKVVSSNILYISLFYPCDGTYQDFTISF